LELDDSVDAAGSVRFFDAELSIVSGFKELEECLTNIDVLVNTASLGMNRDTLSVVRLTCLPRTAVVYDMAYAPPVTPLLEEAARLGFKGANGLGMLAAQGEGVHNLERPNSAIRLDVDRP